MQLATDSDNLAGGLSSGTPVPDNAPHLVRPLCSQQVSDPFRRSREGVSALTWAELTDQRVGPVPEVPTACATRTLFGSTASGNRRLDLNCVIDLPEVSCDSRPKAERFAIPSLNRTSGLTVRPKPFGPNEKKPTVKLDDGLLDSLSRDDWRSFEPLIAACVDAALSPGPETIAVTWLARLPA